MSRKEDWFKHSLKSRADLRMQAFLGKFGAAGYGLFWMLVEELYESRIHRIPDVYTKIGLYTFVSFCIESQVREMIDFLVSIGLFKLENGALYSEKVDREVAEREGHEEHVSNVRRDAVGKRWQKDRETRESLANENNHLHTNGYKTIQNDTNDTRGEERRVDNRYRSDRSISGGHPSGRPKKETGEVDGGSSPEPNLTDEFEKLAEANLQKPDSQPWTKGRAYLKAHRRPMVNYPDIHIARGELADVFRGYKDRGIPKATQREIFKEVQSEMRTYLVKNKKPELTNAYRALTTWGLDNKLRTINETVKIERNSGALYGK